MVDHAGNSLTKSPTMTPCVISGHSEFSFGRCPPYQRYIRCGTARTIPACARLHFDPDEQVELGEFLDETARSYVPPQPHTGMGDFGALVTHTGKPARKASVDCSELGYLMTSRQPFLSLMSRYLLFGSEAVKFLFNRYRYARAPLAAWPTWRFS